jgi:hypothetical protein
MTMARARLPVVLHLLAVLPCAAPADASESPTVVASLTAGTRLFDLAWQTAAAPSGNGVNPPFSGEWNDLAAAEGTVGLGVRFAALQLRGEATYGRIFAGRSSISAFADDSRDQVTYRSEQRSDRGDTREATVAMGVRMRLARSVEALCEIGYSGSEQRVVLRDGVQAVPASGPYSGLDSRYLARWQGHWLGLEGTWDVLAAWTLSAAVRYQWVAYHGELDLNLRDDLAHPRSVEQSGNGHAIAAGLGVAWHLTRRTAVDLQVSREDARVSDGRDQTNYANGGSDVTRLEEASLGAWVLRCGLRWEY